MLLSITAWMLASCSTSSDLPRESTESPVPEPAPIQSAAQDAFRDGIQRTPTVKYELEELRAVLLGRSNTEMPLQPRAATLTPSNIAVADGGSASVVVYGQDGTFQARFTKVGGGRLEQPYRLRYEDGELVVLDLTGRVRLSAAQKTASELAAKLKVAQNAIDWARRGSDWVLATNATDPAQRHGVIAAYANDGTLRWTACPPNPTLQSALRTNSPVAFMQATLVEVQDSTIYCVQPTSNAVQMYSVDGRLRGAFTRVPAAYRTLFGPSGAGPEAMRQVTASGYAVSGVYPSRTGIALDFFTLDTLVNRERHIFFACDSSSGATRCTETEPTGRVVQFRAPDTLVTMGDSLMNGTPWPTLRFWRLRPERVAGR
ncbi:hypothetical protein [Gemmatimonas sp.]|uniref:hypothetical protein n=1 Tax=Gemmatimonas sp. TaxID=1962908 RepID=UPI003341D586